MHSPARSCFDRSMMQETLLIRLTHRRKGLAGLDVQSWVANLSHQNGNLVAAAHPDVVLWHQPVDITSLAAE